MKQWMYRIIKLIAHPQYVVIDIIAIPPKTAGTSHHVKTILIWPSICSNIMQLILLHYINAAECWAQCFFSLIVSNRRQAHKSCRTVFEKRLTCTLPLQNFITGTHSACHRWGTESIIGRRMRCKERVSRHRISCIQMTEEEWRQKLHLSWEVVNQAPDIVRNPPGKHDL